MDDWVEKVRWVKDPLERQFARMEQSLLCSMLTGKSATEEELDEYMEWWDFDKEFKSNLNRLAKEATEKHGVKSFFTKVNGGVIVFVKDDQEAIKQGVEKYKKHVSQHVIELQKELDNAQFNLNAIYQRQDDY